MKTQAIPGTGSRLVVVLLILSGLAATGCPRSGSSSADKTTIVLITPLSGEVQDLGKEMLACAQLAVKDANADNPERPVRLLARDDQMSAATAATAARGAAQQDEAVAIVAAGTSALAKAQIEALKDTGVPLVTPTATASDLAGGADYVFRVIPPNSAQGEALAEFARRLGATKAAILFQQDDYALDLKESFKRHFTDRGGKVLLEVGVESDESDFRPQIGRLNKAGPDVILCAAQHVPVARFLVRAKELCVCVPVLSGETAFTDKLLNAAGQVDVPFYLTGPVVDRDKPSGILKRFLDAYRAENNGATPGIYGCYTYDAVRLLASLAQEKKATTGAKMLEALREVKDYAGVTGNITLSDKGEVRPKYRIYTLKNKAFKPVQEK